ncbi:MAG: GDSL-type esterase/lipase family protein [Polyangiaceae bacterium]
MSSQSFPRPSATALAAAAVAGLAVCLPVCGERRGPVSPPESSRAAPSAGPTRSTELEAPPAAPTPSASATPNPSRRRYTVAVIGDSLTDARSGGGKFVDHLQARCKQSRFDNFGKGGDMVNQMRRRFERDVLANGTSYTHVVFFGGVNDLYSDLTAGRTPEKVEADLEAMFSAAKHRGFKVVAVTVAPWGGFTKFHNPKRQAATRELNEWILRQAKEQRIDAAVDAYALLQCGESEKLCPDFAKPYRDGLHFGPAGHEKLGAALFDAAFSDCE